MLDVSSLLGRAIVFTEKCDGSNLTYTRDAIFARSHNGPPTHDSFDLAKATHAHLKYKIPAGLSIFCEYCYAIHSIEYVALPSYSLVFGVRDDSTREWWGWEMVEAMAQDLGLPTVPEICRGVLHTEADLREVSEAFALRPSDFGGTREGVVVRVFDSFRDEDFDQSLAKWVRKDHVSTDEHWTKMIVRPQRLSTSARAVSCNMLGSLSN